MKNILSILFFIIPLINTFSQDQRAELIFNDGDVLEGFGMITKDNKIKFRISLKEKPDKWNYEIVKGIIFYVSIQLENLSMLKSIKSKNLYYLKLLPMEK